MRKKEKRLLLARNIFVFIVFVSLGVIIVTEKSKGLLIPKVKEKMEEYIETKYQDQSDDWIKNEISLKDNIYQMKVSSKENKNLFFYIIQKNKKIEDTYQTDYFEGNSLFTSIQKSLEQQIKEKTNTSPSIEIISTLDNYTNSVKKRIIEEDNLLELKFYILKKEILINNWTATEITNNIIKTINTYEKKQITPKSYTFIINNKNKIQESIEIKNITSSFIENPNNIKIIQDILEDKNTKLLKENDIKYKYKYKED